MDIARPDIKARLRRRRGIYLGVGSLAVVTLVLFVANTGDVGAEVEKDSLWIETVKRGDMVREIVAPGVLVPEEVRWLTAESSARVERILLQPGAAVEPDSVIIELRNPEAVVLASASEAALKTAQAEHATRRMNLENQLLDQRATLAQVVSEYETALSQADAERDLADEGIISRIQYMRTRRGVDLLRMRVGIEKERMAKLERAIPVMLAAEDTQLEQLRNDARLRRGQVEALRLRAGMSGILQQVFVQAGQQVAVGQNLAVVAKPDRLMASLNIPEGQVKDVAVGQVVTVDTGHGHVIGRVHRIHPAVVNGIVRVDVELPGKLPSGVRPDLSVEGVIQVERLRDVLYVARPVNSMPHSETTLFVVNEDGGSARRVPVGLGRASADRIEVRHGLRAGDRVIVSDSSSWRRQSRLELE